MKHLRNTDIMHVIPAIIVHDVFWFYIGCHIYVNFQHILKTVYVLSAL